MTRPGGASPSQSMARGVSPMAALARCSLFDGLAHADLVAVGLMMRSRELEPGTTLCRAGHRGDRLYVVVDGLAEVIPGTGVGDGEPAARLRRGDVTGAASLLTGEPHASTVVAATRTEVLELGREDLERLADRFPAILRNAVRILSRRLARSYRQEDRSRGEVVALIFAAGLAAAVPRVTAAAAAASARPVAVLDTRSGLQDVLAQLDDRLEDGAGTVVILARAEGGSAPILLDHVDRVVLLVEEPWQANPLAGTSPAAGSRIEVVLVARTRHRRRRAPPSGSCAAATRPARCRRMPPPGSGGSSRGRGSAWRSAPAGRRATRTSASSPSSSAPATRSTPSRAAASALSSGPTSRSAWTPRRSSARYAQPSMRTPSQRCSGSRWQGPRRAWTS